MKGLQNQVAQIKGLENLSLWQRVNSIKLKEEVIQRIYRDDTENI